MKKVLGLVMAAVVAVGVSAVVAGPGCGAKSGCALSKAKAQVGADCAAALSKINLTDDQKAKMATLQEQAKRAPSTSEGNAILAAGMEKILTPEQLAECKTNCAKDKGGAACPFMSQTDKKS